MTLKKKGESVIEVKGPETTRGKNCLWGRKERKTSIFRKKNSRPKAEPIRKRERGGGGKNRGGNRK